ncbi:MAG: hypothetical protein KDA20_04600 [Phycisphaerales bacterium]|nr:hypothetical protein [Phycisphaerales bacterium]
MKRSTKWLASVASCAFLAATVGAQDEAPASFPHLTIDPEHRFIEFEGLVPIDAHDPDAPRVYLEQVVCGRDSKEHESLVVSDAKASHIHAALLLFGLEPGKPATFEADDSERGWKSNPPEGPQVDIEFRWSDDAGAEHTAHPSEWIVGLKGEAFDEGHWVFAGSRFVTRGGEERYDADYAGTIVGLVTFGSEVLAWPTVMHNEAAREEPEWIARNDAVPKRGTKVTVRLTPVK